MAVLGSGWLLDVPLEHLAARCRKIYLVDIHHPPQVRKRTERIDSVELVEADLTGGAISQFWKLAKDRDPGQLEALTESILLEAPLPGLHPDMIISVNLLNQLDTILCDFLKEKGIFKDDQSLDHLRSVIQSFHLEWITSTPGMPDHRHQGDKH